MYQTREGPGLVGRFVFRRLGGRLPWGDDFLLLGHATETPIKQEGSRWRENKTLNSYDRTFTPNIWRPNRYETPVNSVAGSAFRFPDLRAVALTDGRDGDLL